MNRLTVRTVAVAAFAAALLASGGVPVWGSAQTIHGCASNATGHLRLADSCLPTESDVEWNQTGPAGPPGISAFEVVEFTVHTPRADPGQLHFFRRDCPQGKKVLSGGFDFMEIPFVAASEHPRVLRDAPIIEGIGWELGLRFHVATAPTEIRLRLVCAHVG